jgi:hypothetical protein
VAFGCPQVLRLVNLDAVLDGERLDRAWRGMEPATGGTVGLRQNQSDLVPGFDQPGEGAFSEGRRTGKDEDRLGGLTQLLGELGADALLF